MKDGRFRLWNTFRLTAAHASVFTTIKADKTNTKGFTQRAAAYALPAEGSGDDRNRHVPHKGYRSRDALTLPASSGESISTPPKRAKKKHGEVRLYVTIIANSGRCGTSRVGSAQAAERATPYSTVVTRRATKVDCLVPAAKWFALARMRHSVFLPRSAVGQLAGQNKRPTLFWSRLVV